MSSRTSRRPRNRRPAVARDQPPRAHHRRHGRDRPLLPRHPRRPTGGDDRHAALQALLLRVRPRVHGGVLQVHEHKHERLAKPAGTPHPLAIQFDHLSFNVPDEEALLDLQRRLKSAAVRGHRRRRSPIMQVDVVLHRPNGITLEASWWVLDPPGDRRTTGDTAHVRRPRPGAGRPESSRGGRASGGSRRSSCKGLVAFRSTSRTARSHNEQVPEPETGYGNRVTRSDHRLGQGGGVGREKHTMTVWADALAYYDKANRRDHDYEVIGFQGGSGRLGLSVGIIARPTSRSSIASSARTSSVPQMQQRASLVVDHLHVNRFVAGAQMSRVAGRYFQEVNSLLADAEVPTHRSDTERDDARPTERTQPSGAAPSWPCRFGRSDSCGAVSLRRRSSSAVRRAGAPYQRPRSALVADRRGVLIGTGVAFDLVEDSSTFSDRWSPSRPRPHELRDYPWAIS